MKRIQGRKVELRALRKSDLMRVARWLNDPHTAYYMGVKTPVTKSSQQEWYEALGKDPARKVFAIVLRRSGRHIGNISLSAISERDRNAALNIFIGDRRDRGRGYSDEAMILLLKHCFEDLGMHRVYLMLHSDNAAALRLYRACGFTREGVLRDHEQYDGKYVDKIVMGILADEFNNEEKRCRD